MHPQFGFAIRWNYRTLAFCRFVVQAIRRLRTFGVLADSTLGVLGLTKVRLAPIGKLFPDDSEARVRQGHTGHTCPAMATTRVAPGHATPSASDVDRVPAMPNAQRCEAFFDVYAQHLCRPVRPFLDEMSL